MTSLRSELAMSNSKVGVSIVCPGEVTTNIVNSTFQSYEPAKNKSEVAEDTSGMLEVAAEDAQNTYPISPSEAAQGIFAGIESKEFYIFTHKGYERQLKDISSEYLEAFDRAMFQ